MRTLHLFATAENSKGLKEALEHAIKAIDSSKDSDFTAMRREGEVGFSCEYEIVDASEGEEEEFLENFKDCGG